MKYNITINQPLMIEYDLNITQWCILDVISVAPSWCEPVTKEDEVYFWVARQKIAEELKALDLKADTIYRNIKKLVELGFLDYEKLGKKDLIRLSKKGKKLFISTMSEINPNNYVGNKSEKNSEINPTYNNTSSNNKTNNIADSEEVYSKYTELLKASSSKQRSINNISKWLKEYSKEDLINSIINYNNVANRQYLKDCANFFGVSKESNGFFKDYIKEEKSQNHAYGGWA